MNTYNYNEIEVGHEESFNVSVGLEEMELFRRITGDENPLHTEHRIAYGMLTASYLSTLAGMYLPGERSLIQQVKLDFLRPLDLCEKTPRELLITGKVEAKDDNFHTILIKYNITDNFGVKVLRGTMRVGIRE